MTPVRSKRVLLCVHGEAPEVPAVAAELRDRWGVEPAFFDPARFPTDLGLSVEYGPSGGFGCVWAEGGGRAEAVGVDALWQGVVIGGELSHFDDATRRTCVEASEIAVAGMLESTGAFQLDPYWSAARASNKPYQIRLAPSFGLEVPATLISNDPDAVRAFARRRGPLITKMLVQPTAPGAGGETPVVFTSAVSEADLAELSGLRFCPMIFQERVENALDVRVNVVGRRLFGAALGAEARGGTDVDWRRDCQARGERAAWQPYELPAPLAAGVVQMLDRLGLNGGAFDFLVTPKGRHVFLELNPFGSFCFLGPACSTPIAAAIAEVLVDPGARRPLAQGRHG